MRLPRALGGAAPWSPLRIGVFVLAGVALLLPAWALYLAVVLPREHVAPNWDVVWVGLDLGLATLAAAAVLAFRRRSPWTPVLGGALAAALVCDAWFDVMTSDGERPLVRRRPGASSRSSRLPRSPPWSASALFRQALRDQAEAAVDDQRLAAHHLGLG